MALTERPRIGFDSLYYAVLDDSTDTSGGTPSWDTPVLLSGAIDVTFDPGGMIAELAADNNASAYSTSVSGSKKLTLNVADVLPSALEDLLGHSSVSGALYRHNEDQAPNVAIMGRILKSGENSGAPVYEYIVLYKCKFHVTPMTATTKGEGIDYGTATLEGIVSPLVANGYYMTSIRSDDPSASATIISGWFTTPYIPSSDSTALTATIAEGTGATAGKIEVTFAKGSSASFSIVTASVTSSTIIVATSAGIKAGTWSVAGAGTTVICTFTPTVAFSSSDVVGVAVTNDVYDNSSVHATIAADLITIA